MYYIFMCIYIFAYNYAYVYAFVYICIYLCLFVVIYKIVQLYMHIYFICTYSIYVDYAHICIYTHGYIYMYADFHINIDAYMLTCTYNIYTYMYILCAYMCRCVYFIVHFTLYCTFCTLLYKCKIKLTLCCTFTWRRVEFEIAITSKFRPTIVAYIAKYIGSMISIQLMKVYKHPEIQFYRNHQSVIYVQEGTLYHRNSSSLIIYLDVHLGGSVHCTAIVTTYSVLLTRF